MSKVKELLSKKEAWTKGCFARDEHGKEVGYNDESACCFCLSGAVRKCYPGPEKYEAFDRLRAAIKEHAGLSLGGSVLFNDRPETTHADILAVLEKAGV